MSTFLLSLLQERFWIPSVLCILLGLFLPGEYAGLQWTIPVLLGGILFLTSLRIALSSVHSFSTRGRSVGLVFGLSMLRLVLIPVLLGLCFWGWVGPWHGGMLLVMAIPPGLSSVAFADLYRGHVILALFLVLVTGLLCPLTIPLLMNGFHGGGTWELGSLFQRFGYLIVQLIVPFGLGQLIRGLWPRFVVRHHQVWSYGAIACTISLSFVGMAALRQYWTDEQGFIDYGLLLTVLGWTCLAHGAAMLLGLLCHCFLETGQSMAFNLGNIFVNGALGLSFAVVFYGDQPGVVLPLTLVIVPMTVWTAIYGRWMLRRQSVERMRSASAS